MSKKYNLIHQFERFTNEHGFELDQNVVQYLRDITTTQVRTFIQRFRTMLVQANLTIAQCFSWITA